MRSLWHLWYWRSSWWQWRELWQRLLVYLECASGRSGVAVTVGLGLLWLRQGPSKPIAWCYHGFIRGFTCRWGCSPSRLACWQRGSCCGEGVAAQAGGGLCGQRAGLGRTGGAWFFALGAGQNLRFFTYEKTRVASLGLRLLPAPRRPGAVRPGAIPPRPASPLPEGPRRPLSDVVLITVDATRADHVGAYGYGRPTTPNIDALARRGVRFERAYAQARTPRFLSPRC